MSPPGLLIPIQNLAPRLQHLPPAPVLQTRKTRTHNLPRCFASPSLRHGDHILKAGRDRVLVRCQRWPTDDILLLATIEAVFLVFPNAASTLFYSFVCSDDLREGSPSLFFSFVVMKVCGGRGTCVAIRIKLLSLYFFCLFY
ncbi:hypothetical protein L873DRAFT_1171807 [Choiromyces venosus 120613-1]|uniref:Uncharacterized protein n=1 Tax=Choiromyces venosus 120613-1 TaxID=1336337 RepID=A0A3N4K384_9PEZI|nr:hypothetical protein L873DRAFT_1171807 [Choiromyces venosus 120613-1]